MRRAFLLAWLAVLTTFGVTGDAGAVVYCVNESPCLGTPKDTIQEALEEADSNGTEDSIFVGSNLGAPYNETLFYNSLETVHLVGDGVGQTIIQGPASDQNAVILLSPASTISNLTIRAPDVDSAAALVWNGTASNIEAVHDGSSATNTVGMHAEGAALLEDSTVSIDGLGLFEISNSTGEGVEIRNSTLTGRQGIDAIGEDLTITRSNVISNRSPVETGGPGTLEILNSLLRLTGSAFGDGAISVLSGGEVLARHVTMDGAGEGAGVYADANTESITVAMADSIIHEFKFALRCFGTLPHTTELTVSYSNWTEETEVADDGCDETLEPGNDEVTKPGFVSTNPLLLDFRLRAPSPLIDAAAPANPLSVDLLGAPRPVDGDGLSGARSDMGAYEYQRQPPLAEMVPPGGVLVAGQAASFTGVGIDPDPGDVLTYSWDFGDGGTAEGSAALHAFEKAGEYTVELIVTDPTGLSDTATAKVEVVATAAEPVSGQKPKEPKKPKKPKAGAQISGLQAVPRRIRRGRGLPKLVKGLKRPGFQFSLSRKSDVVLTLARCRGKRGCKRRRRVKGSAAFTAAKGDSTIKFRGRLTGPKLRRGRYRATLSTGADTAAVIFRLI